MIQIKDFLIKNIRYFLFLLVLISGGISYYLYKETYQREPRTIAIIQASTFPFYEEIYKGIIAGLREKGYRDGRNIQILTKNIRGDLALIPHLIYQIMEHKPDIIISISTAVTQEIVKALQKRSKYDPLKTTIIFTGITDPVKAGIIPSLENPGPSITGICERLPLDQQILLIKNLLPSAEKIGFIYASQEQNSSLLLEQLYRIAESHEVRILARSISRLSDMSRVATTLAREVDVFLVGNDLMVIEGMDSLLDISHAYRLLVFASDVSSIKKGALGGYSLSQYATGLATGHMADTVLKRTDPHQEIPVEIIQEARLYMNREIVQRFHISLPEIYRGRVIFIQ